MSLTVGLFSQVSDHLMVLLFKSQFHCKYCMDKLVLPWFMFALEVISSFFTLLTAILSFTTIFVTITPQSHIKHN